MDEFHCTLEQIIEIKREYGHIRRLFIKDSALVIDILRQIADGIKCLHSIDTPHGDLRPANVVVMPLAGDEKQNVQIKLANLRRTKPSADYLLSGWAGPEVFHSPKPCLASDIFSLGCIFAYVMTDGDHPFGNDNLKRVANIVTNKPKKDYLANIDNTALGKLISAMIIKEHDERPNITSITGILAKLSLKMIEPCRASF